MTDPALSPEELRVLGCLAEKDRATPQNYPLTLNALRLACNQATGREPVVAYDDHTVEAAVTSLKDKGLVRFVFSTSNRATKYRHILDERLALDSAELAALTVLVLRGPQTLGEIKGRTERLHPFVDLASVEVTLDRLAAREEPLVMRLPRQPGHKEARYVHLLGRDTTEALADVSALATGSVTDHTGSVDRIAALEAEVETLREAIGQLRRDFDAFRAEFS